MSIKAIAWAWDQDLPAVPKMVLLALGDCHNNETGQCNPRVKYLAKKAGLAESTVTKHLAALLKDQFIEIQHNYREDGSLTSSDYSLMMLWVPHVTPLPGPPHSPGETPARDQEPGIDPNKEPTPSVPSDFLAKSSVTPGAAAPKTEEVGIHVSINPSVKRIQPVEVDETFRERMRVKYAGVLSDIDDRMDECLAYYATSKRHKNKQLTVQNWLRRDSEKLKSGTNSAPAAALRKGHAEEWREKSNREKESEVPYQYTPEGKKETQERNEAWKRECYERAAHNLAARRRAGENE